jgi:molybdopterin molybdotransferase
MAAVADLTSFADAQRLVLERAKPLEAERVPIERAAGRVLAEPAAAATDLPPFPSSAMDGIAVRAADTAGAPVTLPLAGEVAAGHPSDAPLGPGQAMRIATGGVVPEGADAVIPVEVIAFEDGGVRVESPAAPGANVRERGGDIRTGETVLEPGVALGPAQVAALAAAGVAEVRCTKRPRVAILVTGSELRSPGEELGPGEIYESNALLLAAGLGAAGAVPAQLGVVPDDPDALAVALERALLGFDVLVTSGGASVGEHDLVRAGLRDQRVEELFWGVAMKPGKPVAFGVRRDHLVFTLPGNPVSVLVTFAVLVRPAVNALLGLSDPLPRGGEATLTAPLRRDPARMQFVRARVQGGEAEPLVGQDSHMAVRSGRANALVPVEAGDGELSAGTRVSYLDV